MSRVVQALRALRAPEELIGWLYFCIISNTAIAGQVSVTIFNRVVFFFSFHKTYEINSHHFTSLLATSNFTQSYGL